MNGGPWTRKEIKSEVIDEHMCCGSGGDLRAFQAFHAGGDGCTICSYFIFQAHSFASLGRGIPPCCSYEQDLYFLTSQRGGGSVIFSRGLWAEVRKEREGLGLKALSEENCLELWRHGGHDSSQCFQDTHTHTWVHACVHTETGRGCQALCSWNYRRLRAACRGWSTPNYWVISQLLAGQQMHFFHVNSFKFS